VPKCQQVNLTTAEPGWRTCSKATSLFLVAVNLDCGKNVLPNEKVRGGPCSRFFDKLGVSVADVVGRRDNKARFGQAFSSGLKRRFYT